MTGNATPGGVTTSRGARVSVEIDLGARQAQGWVWTNDLTSAYVHENSASSS